MGSDQMAGGPAGTPAAVRWARLIVIIALTIGIPAGIIKCNVERRPYLDFVARRTAWQERCAPEVPEKYRRPAAICTRELDALLTEARLNGWTK